MLKTVIFKFHSVKFLSFLIREEKPADTQVEDDEEEKFVPSLLNSTVYIISMALQVSTFAINYRVRPSFMLLEENGLKEERSFNHVPLLCLIKCTLSIDRVVYVFMKM